MNRLIPGKTTVQVELFKDRLTVFSPGPMHRNMKFELLAEDHQSYAVNPIIAHALFYVQYIEELGTGTVDIFNICKATGLPPPVFDIDAQHFMVTVYRPEFDEQGNRIPIDSGEVGQKIPEVGQNPPEIGQKIPEVGQKPLEVGQKPDFDAIMKNYRKDFRKTCANVWECLAADGTLPRKAIAVQLKIAESTVQSATNALQEVGLLEGKGRGKGKVWIVRTAPNGERSK